MLHIAVCDDDRNAVQTHKQIAKCCLAQCKSAGEISVYTDSANLLYDITEDGFFFDLILLDIEMPGGSGMELAQKIKPYLPHGKIIFITSHIEYAIDAFELAIFRYVPKDDIDTRLPAAIMDAVKLIMLEEGKVIPSGPTAGLRRFPIKRSIISRGMAKTPESQPLPVCPKCAKVCSRYMRSWGQRSLSISTGAVSST